MKTNKERITEIIRYLIVGVLTTVVSLGIYYGLVYTVLNPDNVIELQIANIISWIGAVIFAYITNRVFVFKSQNQNRLKEATSFFGSRLLTLLMDMAIMFLGVTILKQNDKIIKLMSQVIITVSNYVFSKIFVFNNNKKENREKREISSTLLYIILLSIPFLDFLYLILPYKEITTWLIAIIKGGILLGFALYLWKEKESRTTLILALSFLVIISLYSFCKEKDVLITIKSLLEILVLPIALIFFTKNKNTKINKKFLAIIFYLYGFLFLIAYAVVPTTSIPDFYYAKKEILAILIFLLPITLNVLWQHNNYLTKILGFLFVGIFVYFYHSFFLNISALLTILYLIWQNRKEIKKEKIWCLLGILLLVVTIFNLSAYSKKTFETKWEDKIHQITKRTDFFMNGNIDEQIFGIEQIEDSRTSVDLLDIFYDFGCIGIFLYILILASALGKIKTLKEYKFALFLAFALSIFNGNVLTGASVSLFLSILAKVSNDKKTSKILLVSNMYPSRKYKHYGSFVKNTKEELEIIGFQVDKVVLKKHRNILIKIISYLCFYSKAFIKSLFVSYDFYYVHFVSHSTYPVIFAKKTGKTKLVCNVHGNDIVPDYDFEIKNVNRSKRVLPLADTVVAPSKYFAEVLTNTYHISKEKIKIYPSGGINFAVFQEKDQKICQKELGLDPKYTYIGMVSRIEKNKGWDTLLEALNELKKESFMKNIKVIIVGTGQEQPEMEQKIKEFHLEEKIIQKEFVLQKDLVNYYNAFDVLIFPTKRKSDSLGLVGLEAMACKTFLIACDLYGPKEYARNHENALTYQNGTNGKELAAKIKEFMNMKKEEKNKIIKNAYETAKKYDINTLDEKLKKIFIKTNSD